MRVVLAVTARGDVGAAPDQRRRAVETARRRAGALAGFAVPVDTGELVAQSWTSAEGEVSHVVWHNERRAPFGEVGATDRGGMVTVVGYTGTPAASLLGVAGDALLDRSVELTGCFGIVRSRAGRAEAVTDATRSVPLFVAESPRLRIVGSRALLVHLLAEADRHETDSPRPDLDLVGMRHFGNAGYFLGNLTAFRGVSALATAERVTIDTHAIRRERRPATSGPTGTSVDDYPSLVADVAAALVEAFDPLAGGDLNLALTGGRDSRLIAAALSHRPDINLTTATTGAPEDPDVVIAAQVADVLGVPHRVARPAGVTGEGAIVAEDPLSRIVRNLDVHDAATSGWDDIEDYGPMMPTPLMSGVGGEIARGGLVLPELDELTPDTMRTRLENMLVGGTIFTAAATESARAIAAPLIELAASDPYRASDDFYYEHRNGRWVAARRSGARFRRHIVDPLLDNLFVRRLRLIPPDVRWSERLVFDVVGTLRPELRDLPIEGARWRFERQGPAPGVPAQEREAWGLRAPLVRTRTTARWSWQRLDHPVARQRVTELILDGMGSGRTEELFDRARVAQFLSAPELRYPTLVWHLATTVVALTTPWWLTVRPPRTPTLLLEM